MQRTQSPFAPSRPFTRDGGGAGGGMAATAGVAYEAPLLELDEIAACLQELGLHVAAEDLRNPQPDMVRRVYEFFVDLHLGVSRNDLLQPKFSAMDVFEQPDLHEESVPLVVFQKALTTLMETCHANFRWSDVTHPSAKRTQRLFSALINFSKFREERLSAFQGYIQETSTLHDRHLHMEESNQQLLVRVMGHRARRTEEQPRADSLAADVAKLEDQINRMNQEQVA